MGFYNMNYKPYGIVGREQNKLNWQLNLLNCVYLTHTVIFSLSVHTVLASAWIKCNLQSKHVYRWRKHFKECTYQEFFPIFLQVHGKRFVYKFVCDLKQLLGYSASELNRLVEECARKSLNVGQHFSTTWWWITICSWTVCVYLGMCIIFLN